MTWKETLQKIKDRQPPTAELIEVRCPYCHKMACKAAAGSVLEIKCPNRHCRRLFTWPDNPGVLRENRP
jgi:hypothetical protein